MDVTPPSICSWLDHPVSGLMLQTTRPVQTRFPCAYTYRFKLACNTKSLTHYTKGTPSGPNAPPTACKHSVSGSLHHCTRSLSVTKEYLALEDGPPIFKQDFSCPALLSANNSFLRIPAYHRLGSDFPFASAQYVICNRLVRVRSPLLTESRLISFPRAT